MSNGLNFPDAVPELFGDQAYLRELSERDIRSWFARATDTESADLAGDPVPGSIEAGTKWLQRHRDRFRERTAIRWAIVAPGSAESIGTVGLKITSQEPLIGELGIVINRAYWGRGIGTTAARVATSYAFNTLGLTEIQAEVIQSNLASVRLLEKVGFHLLRAVPAGAETDSDACFIYALQCRSRSAA